MHISELKVAGIGDSITLEKLKLALPIVDFRRRKALDSGGGGQETGKKRFQKHFDDITCRMPGGAF